MKKTKKNIDHLINKVISETLSEKADDLVKNINELGGMGGDRAEHPRFGKINFATITDKELDDLMKKPVDDFYEKDEFESQADDLSDEETNEGFDSEEVFINRRGKDYSPKEFRPIPKPNKADYLSNLDMDSMDMSKYHEKYPEDDFDFEDEDDDEGSELVTEDTTCEQCGTKGSIMEGECSECGWKMGSMDEGIYDVEDLGKSEFDYVESNEESCKYHIQNFGKDDERTKEVCRGLNESLKGRQRVLDKNKNNKIDAEDFKLLRKSKGETKESSKPDFLDLDKDGDKKEPMKSAAKDAKKNKKHSKTKSKQSVKLTENEIIDLIEKLVKEESSNLRKGTKHKGTTVYEKAHKGSGKENSDYIKSVTKKMKDYLKDGSKGEYSMEPKMFPKGNGELAKMSKKAYIPSDAVQDYTDNLTAAGLENLTYDEIHPNEDWVNDLMVGSSKTGNNPEWANAVDTGVNKKRRKVQKDNLLGQIKRKAYNKAPQPIVTDKTGEDSASKLMVKLESTEEKNDKNLNEEFGRMKELLSYNRKTQ